MLQNFALIQIKALQIDHTPNRSHPKNPSYELHFCGSFLYDKGRV